MIHAQAALDWMVCTPFFRRPQPEGVRRRGQVIHGNKLGRRIGIPTANIRLGAREALAFGIYAVIAGWRGGRWAGAASWGTRPQLDDGAPLLEVHLLDFSGDLYGDELTVEFVRYLRPEQRFATLDAMLMQIGHDIAATRRVTAPLLAFAASSAVPPRDETEGCGLGRMLEGGVFS